jgi:hypothetical protein
VSRERERVKVDDMHIYSDSLTLARSSAKFQEALLCGK